VRLASEGLNIRAMSTGLVVAVAGRLDATGHFHVEPQGKFYWLNGQFFAFP
jgi:hypothetical protein